MPEIKLQTNDGRNFSVDTEVIKCSKTLKTMLEDLGMDGVDDIIPLPNISGDVFEKIHEWAIAHKNDELLLYDDAELKKKIKAPIAEWDQQFLDAMSCKTLLAVTIAVNYLEINPLLEMCSKQFSKLMKGYHTVEGLRRRLDIKPPHQKNEQPADDAMDAEDALPDVRNEDIY